MKKTIITEFNLPADESEYKKALRDELGGGDQAKRAKQADDFEVLLRRVKARMDNRLLDKETPEDEKRMLRQVRRELFGES